MDTGVAALALVGVPANAFVGVADRTHGTGVATEARLALPASLWLVLLTPLLHPLTPLPLLPLLTPLPTVPTVAGGGDPQSPLATPLASCSCMGGS
jgi:hypothetical protein